MKKTTPSTQKGKAKNKGKPTITEFSQNGTSHILKRKDMSSHTGC